jgi:excisionase family DNA binding protein
MDRLLTVNQRRELLNTGPRFVQRLIAERRIEFGHMGWHVRIIERCIDQVCRGGPLRRDAHYGRRP